MVHILIVSQYFFPESFRINDIAKELVKKGNKVTVVTGIPNYPQGIYYEGYSTQEKRYEEWEGIDIIRLPIRPRLKGAVNLARNYFSFVTEGRKWIRHSNLKSDVVFTFEVSPMTQALVGIWYSKKYRLRHILYVTDLWPENVEYLAGIHNKIILGGIQIMVDYIYKRSSIILTSSNSFIKAIEKRGVSKDKIIFWPYYAEEFYKPIESVNLQEIPNDGFINIVFAGNIGYSQGLNILPKVAKRLKKQNIFVRINIIGDGRYMPVLRAEIKDAFVEEYFNFIDRKPPEQIPYYVAACDATIITLAKSEVFSITIPSKTQSCLACGRPVFVSADGEVQEIVKKAKAGFVSDAGDVVGLAENIISFSKMSKMERDGYGKNAFDYSKKYFNKSVLINRLQELIEVTANRA